MEHITLEQSQLLMLLAAIVPTPHENRIVSIMQRERLANPHGDHYKPKQRSSDEIIAALRVHDATLIMHEVQKNFTK